MAADIHGAVARGTKSDSDFSAWPGHSTAGWLGTRAQMISLVDHGCPCPVPDTTPSLPRWHLPQGLHPRHIVLFPVFSSFSFLLLSLSSLRSHLLSSSPLFSLPFLPLLQPLSLHRVSFSYILPFLLFTLQTRIDYTFSSVPLLDSGRSQIPYTWPCP